MWQVRWNTLGHLSQQSSSPPFWQTAHQSSLGSSSGSALFSDSGCAAGCGRCSFPDSDPGAGTWTVTFSCCRGFEWAPVLLSGRLDPTLDCTCRQRKCGMYAVRYNDSETVGKVSIWNEMRRHLCNPSNSLYKSNFILVLWFVLDDDDGPWGRPSSSLGWGGGWRLRSLPPGSRPASERSQREEMGGLWPWYS